MTETPSSTTDRDLTTCGCCGDAGVDHSGAESDDGTTGAATDGGVSADAPDPRADDPRWIDGDEFLDAPLPADVQSRLGTALGEDDFETMGAWIEAGRRLTGGGALDVADLCHTDEPTGHWGEYDGVRYDFHCFYDAVALAALVDEWVAIHTETPGGATLEFGATPEGDIVDAPADAVLSFGVSEAVAPPESDDQVAENLYAAMCPYVRAFEDYDAYRDWADEVDAASVAVPLAEASDVALALAE